MSGGSHSPSSSSSQSRGTLTEGSGTLSGASSSHPFGFLAFASSICEGSVSSQSSGFDAEASSILASSTQRAGFLSVGSSIFSVGLTGGLKSVSESSDTSFFSSLSTRILTDSSVPMIAVYRCDFLSFVLGVSGEARCFSSYWPVFLFLCRIMKWILLVSPHLSGPNMMV